MKQRKSDLLAIVLVFVAYATTIRLALGLDLAGCLLGAIANTIPVIVFGVAVRRVVVQRLVGSSLWVQLGAHGLLCVAFTTLSYLLLIVLLGLFQGSGADGFVVKPFPTSGMAWQLLENVTTYALIATLSHLQALSKSFVSSSAAAPGLPGPSSPGGSSPAVPSLDFLEVDEPKPIAAAVENLHRPGPAEHAGSSLSRYFVRIGEELRPLDLDSVVSIAGADDYAEVRTVTGTYLVRVTLAEFARSLDPAKYIRVHRSWIVNTHRITHAEPAGGGRLLLHMETGPAVAASREGSRLLRNRVI